MHRRIQRAGLFGRGERVVVLPTKAARLVVI